MCVRCPIEFVVFFWLKWHITDASLERFPSAKFSNFSQDKQLRIFKALILIFADTPDHGFNHKTSNSLGNNRFLSSFCIIFLLSFSPSTQQSCELTKCEFQWFVEHIERILSSNMKMKSQNWKISENLFGPSEECVGPD